MKRIIDIDPDMFELSVTYFEGRRTEIQILDESFARQDFLSIRSAAHKMKGVGASFGFEDLTRLGSELEQAAEKNETEKVKNLLLEIRIYLDSVELRQGCAE